MLICDLFVFVCSQLGLFIFRCFLRGVSALPCAKNAGNGAIGCRWSADLPVLNQLWRSSYIKRHGSYRIEHYFDAFLLCVCFRYGSLEAVCFLISYGPKMTRKLN